MRFRIFATLCFCDVAMVVKFAKRGHAKNTGFHKHTVANVGRFA